MKESTEDEPYLKTNRRERDTDAPLAPDLQIHELIKRIGILLPLFSKRLQLLWDLYGQGAQCSNTKLIPPPPPRGWCSPLEYATNLGVCCNTLERCGTLTTHSSLLIITMLSFQSSVVAAGTDCFNITKPCVWSTQYTYVFHMILTINNNIFPQTALTKFYLQRKRHVFSAK
jgi:hypothetical protein